MSESPKAERHPIKLLDQLVKEVGTYGVDVATSPVHELAPRRSFGEAVSALRAAIEAQEETIELAWGVIANAGDGDWSLESKLWQEAAARWRDESYLPAGDPGTGDRERKLDQLLAALRTVTNLARELWGPDAVSMTVDGQERAARRDEHIREGLPPLNPPDVHLDAQGRAQGRELRLGRVTEAGVERPVLEDFARRGAAAQAAVDEILEPRDPGARRPDRAPERKPQGWVDAELEGGANG